MNDETDIESLLQGTYIKVGSSFYFHDTIGFTRDRKKKKKKKKHNEDITYKKHTKKGN